MRTPWRDDMFAGLTDADLVASFQEYIGELLLRAMREAVRAFPTTGYGKVDRQRLLDAVGLSSR